jgi:hypothetical protein
MADKAETVAKLRGEFNSWEELLSHLPEAEITAPQLPSNLSVKNVIAHLWAWQQRSIARLEAGLHNREPRFPRWPAEFDPDSDDDTERVNAWIYETNRDRPWSDVYREWRSGFKRFLDLGDSIPEQDLLDEKKYLWLRGDSLAGVMLASYVHHHDDHREPLQAWLREHGKI